MSKIRWGIIGAGRIANSFAQDLVYADNAELAGVAARRLASADVFAKQHGIATSFEGYDELFCDPNIDAIYIATPHTLHLQNAVDALHAGKAVMCEKPITVSAAECQTLIDTADATQRYLMEAMWTWFLPAIRQAKEWVDAGRIGELRHIKADFGYPQVYAADKREYDANLGGGCLLEMGIYPVAIARYFSGQDPQDTKVTASMAPNGVEDDVTMLFEYDECFATLATSFRCKLQNWAYIIGTDGYIAIPDFWRATECSLFELDERVDYFQDEMRGSGFEYQIASVSNDILNGRLQSSTVPLEASLGFQRDMDCVKEKF